MPDPDRVRAALERQTKRPPPLHAGLATDLEVLAAAARSWLEGTEIRWCETHESNVLDGWESCQFYGLILRDTGDTTKEPCRIVSRRLVGGE